MRIFISGPISGVDDYSKPFFLAEMEEMRKGNTVVNPAYLPTGLDEDRYLPICLAMIDACDAVRFLPGWSESAGARCEEAYAARQGKIRIYPGEETGWNR